MKESIFSLYILCFLGICDEKLEETWKKIIYASGVFVWWDKCSKQLRGKVAHWRVIRCRIKTQSWAEGRISLEINLHITCGQS